MTQVIVTVKREGEARVRDLELPADVSAGVLAGMVAHALHWESDPAGGPIRYAIYAEPPGRVLAEKESLADAEVWDGAWLVFRQVGGQPPPAPSGWRPLPAAPAPVAPSWLPHPAGGAGAGSAPVAAVRPAGPSPGPAPGSPVVGWRSLGIDLPAGPPDSGAADPPKEDEGPGRITWKRLDED